MQNETALYIAQQAKSIMELIAELDEYDPDEDLVEVLIGAVATWGSVEAQVLFSALDAALDGVSDAEEILAQARKRLNILYKLQGMIHEDEYSEEPWSTLVKKYVDAVKFHLLVEIQDIVPLTAQLPPDIARQLAVSMAAMKMDLE